MGRQSWRLNRLNSIPLFLASIRQGNINLSSDAFQPVDWVDALVDLRNQRGLTDALFAAELGVSPAFICMVFARKKPVSWRLKMAIWSRKNYDLSRDAILNLFLPEIGQQLIDMDRQRGQKRAEKIAQKRERKNGITAQSWPMPISVCLASQNHYLIQFDGQTSPDYLNNCGREGWKFLNLISERLVLSSVDGSQTQVC